MATKKSAELVPAAANQYVRYPYLDSDGRLTEKALYQLSKPFPVEDLKWLPQDLKRDGDNETALALVYTDPRSYHERLDQVFGPGNWGTELTFTTSPFFKHIPKKMGWGKDKDTVISEARDVTGYKIYAVCSLHVAGLGVKTSTGDEDTSDGNAATSAEAQAFKRACSMIGIGRYFYSFPRDRKPYKYGKFQELPKVPDWAIPEPECVDTGMPIRPHTFLNKKNEQETWDTKKIVATAMHLFGVPLTFDAIAARRAAQPKAPAKAEPQPAETPQPQENAA
jgi:hypothetical protein